MTTVALGSFRTSQASIVSLLRMEGRFRDPPTVIGLPQVEGLRGGCSVLMVGVFEAYLRESIAEAADSLNRANPRCLFELLPGELQVASVYSSLELAMKGDHSSAGIPRLDRLTAVKGAAGRVQSGTVDGPAIAQTGGNPSSQVVKKLFKSLGLGDVFSVVKSGFDVRWGKPTVSTFPQDTLDSIVKRRHAVAHTGSALSVSRADLSDSQRFLCCLAEELDVELERHIDVVARSAQ